MISNKWLLQHARQLYMRHHTLIASGLKSYITIYVGKVSRARALTRSLSHSLSLSRARTLSLARACVNTVRALRGLGLMVQGLGLMVYGLGRAMRQDSSGTKGPLKEHPRAVIEPDAAPIHAPREGLEEILKIQHTYKEMH